MPDIPISQLPETTTPSSTDVIPIVDGTTTKKVQVANLLGSSTGSSLVGFLQAGTGAVARTVQTKLRQSLHASDFGWDQAASVATNNAAIAAAITALGAGGGLVRLGRGTFSYDALALPDVGSIHLVGEGRDATILSYMGSGTALKKADQTVAKASHVFEGFKILNAGTGTIGLDLTAIWLSRAEELYLSGFTTGIYAQRGSVGVYWNRILQNLIDGCTNGIVLSATGSVGAVNQNWMKNNRISNPTTVGIKVEAACEANTAIENDIESTGVLPRFIDWQGDFGVIERNWLDSTNAGNTGIYLRGVRNKCGPNTYAGTFGTPLDQSGVNEIFEPNRVTAISNIPWTFNSLISAAAGITPYYANSNTGVVSVPNSTTTTLYTLGTVTGTEVGMFIAWNDSGNANIFSIAYVGLDGANAGFAQIASNACTLSRSGNNIQMTHALGSTLSFRYAFLKLWTKP